MDEKSCAFVIYLIHELANAKGLSPAQVYRTLKQHGCIDDYLVPNYEVLHTLGTEYLMDDIGRYIAARGGGI